MIKMFPEKDRDHMICFLVCLRDKLDLPPADRNQDRARQKCARRGLATHSKAGWQITDLGRMALQNGGCGMTADQEAIACAPLEEVRRGACVWTRDKDGRYDTSCGQIFEFKDGSSPRENGARYCLYCGGVLRDPS